MRSINPDYQKVFYFLFIFLVTTSFTGIRSQIVCEEVRFVPNSSEQVDFVFDSFGKYIAGMTVHGVAKLRVRVDDQTPPNPNCKWMLTMSVENNPGSGSLPGEWETLATYGTGSSATPTIEILEVRVTNGCSTSPIDGVYQSFNFSSDMIQIIENTGIVIPAGSCTTNVNGAGSYLTNYDEFNFQIDFKVKPGYNFDAGIYQLQVKFDLVEVP